MKYIKYIILIGFVLYKGFIFNLFANINKYILNNKKEEKTEINIYKNNYDNLLKEYNSLSNLIENNKNNYSISRLCYRFPYDSSYFNISGSHKENNLVVNENGVVGIVIKNNDTYSKCKLITSYNNLNIKINDYYGTINSFKNNLFIINDFSNYDKINLNDKVYTSSLSNIKISYYIGYVCKIETGSINKKIYVKSDVDFNNLNYFYVIGDV